MKAGFLKATLLLAALVGLSALALANTSVPAVGSSAPQAYDDTASMPTGLQSALYRLLARESGSGYSVDEAGCVTLPERTFKACFNATGASFSDSNATTISLRAVAWGRQSRLVELAPVSPEMVGNRVSYDHGPLTEWWRVLPVGFEQGFTIAHSPAGQGKLELVLAANRVPEQNGPALSWGGLRYGKLVVTDATGQVIPSRLKNDGRHILITVNDAHATYPLTVDPLVWLKQEVAVDDSAAWNMLGYGVAVDGDTAIISTAYATVNGNKKQGAAYIFEKKTAPGRRCKS